MRTLALLALVGIAVAASAHAETVQQWDIFELTLRGPSDGNPFADVTLSAQFRQGDRAFEPEGFYDGDGVYRVRFMPDALGTWTYATRSNRKELDGLTGRFTCVDPSPGNHGPIRVRNTVHFAYADGTPYYQVGTTCYAWVHQGDDLEEQTLATLRKAPFNKMRMCVFPKAYTYNQNEPPTYPFEGKPPQDWDFTRFNPAFFRHFEKRVADLRDLGIEADLILFHPYDRWGFKSMDRETDDRYLRYVVARLAAYRNVWWSLANEFDLMLKIASKTMADWDRFFRIIRDSDPYGRLRSNHNCRTWYDHSKPWVTHASVQSSDFDQAPDLPRRYGKPVIYDECKYEGNIKQGWGNITAREMVHRFWLGGLAGCYVGHGETYMHPEDILWWSKGGVLHGQSPPRIAFYRKVMEAAPYEEMTPVKDLAPGRPALAKPGEFYLVYFTSKGETAIHLPGDRLYKADCLDTWAMTVSSVGTARPGRYTFAPPTVPCVLRLEAYKPGEPMRPEAKATATPALGVVPLEVRFAGSGGETYRWDFDDGATSDQPAPVHTYTKPGLYTASLTVTDKAGASATTHIAIGVDRQSDEPIIRVGVSGGETAGVQYHGPVKRTAGGGLDLGAGEPWKWIQVGDEPVEALLGLRSLTILGWVKAANLETGAGGNRIACNLDAARSGFDLVCHADGRLRLAINEWPDTARNDSSGGRVAIGQWVFFAVAYDGTEARDNVRWYFGDAATPAELDRTQTYARGPTGRSSGRLVVGNYSEALHRHGMDRQFRGEIRGLVISGSRLGSQGALSLEAIRKHQVAGR